MFEKLLGSLFSSTPTRLPDADARLAITALLVRIARSDDDYAAVEKDTIKNIIKSRYALDTDGVNDLLTQAESFESEAPDTVRFTRAVKDAVALEDRIKVIESLWQVVLADGARDDGEDALVRLVSNLLGISDVDSAMARKRIEAAK